MFKQQLRREDIFTILGNLVPVAGVWIWNWSVRDVFIAYAMETIIVGIFTILKMLATTLYRGGEGWPANGKITMTPGFVFILFFIIHYGLFVTIQLGLFNSISSTGMSTRLFGFFEEFFKNINEGTAFTLLSLAIAHACRDFFPFLFRKQYKSSSLLVLMFQPYGRVVLQQIVVIFGSIFLMFHFDKVFILLFAGVKIYFDLYVNTSKYVNAAIDGMKKENAKSGK